MSVPESPPAYKYSKSQITQYYQRVKLPENKWLYDVSALKPADALLHLKLLQKHHLAEVPFENLTLHYSSHRAVCVHPEELFRKVVVDNNGRGGYCMENNSLFGTLLRSLGFTLYSGGARVFEGGSWTSLSHMINLVTIGGIKYHVDVGFGAHGPIVPMPLDKSGHVQQHIAPAEARLQWRNIPGNADPDQRLWVYEYRKHHESDWEMRYSYTELEFQPQDYAMMNYFTSTSQRTFFTRTIIAEKKVLDEHGEMAGTLVLMDKILKWKVHGTKEKEVEFSTEAERIEALEKHFGIKLGAADRDGIRELPSEIK